MAYFFQPSLSGLLVQATGALLMTSLCIALWRTMNRRPLALWSFGWATLSLSLGGLWVAFYFDTFRQTGQVVYLFGEYVFGYLVIAGCRNYATGESPSRRDAWLLVPLLALCLALARFAGGNVNVFFAVHTLIYPYLFFSALRELRRVTPNRHTAVGLRVMKLTLLLITIDYLHYAPFFAASSYQGLSVIDAYLAYAPLYDLIFQVTLMFGMVMLVTGQVQHELQAAIADLKRARDRLETTARLDPLTGALNRRAFEAVVQDRRRRPGAGARGVVLVADLDDLKAINDRLGHAAGDAALRILTDALRSCTREGDLLIRWGGDEFVVLLDRETEAGAQARFAALNEKLRDLKLPGSEEAIDLRVSQGMATFDDPASLERAMARADQAMYARKKTA
jgi:diguanylate cyclase (GGDEF)-like protein